jgi:hypothetical protein
MPACRRFALCCALLFPLSLQAGELVILVDTATEMPMARFEQYRLVDGMHKDVGVALARAMGHAPTAPAPTSTCASWRSGGCGIW